MKDCKAISQTAEAIECKPVGGYRIVAGYGAVTENVFVESVDGDFSTQLSPSKADHLAQSVGTIEWRLANGKPFAVIARFVYYNAEKIADALNEGEKPFRTGAKAGEALIVKGLIGYEQIDFEVNVKNTSNPNLKARELADGFYTENLR